ncbi:MAG: hypothetical protein HQM10_09885 [Candidatus Riflebacteria bacterium]|nr:hypothetical protein [Candidatus Riflebacteria bacterium]
MNKKRKLLLIAVEIIILFGLMYYNKNRSISFKWNPNLVLSSKHFEIHSTSSEENTKATLNRAELLYKAYTDFFGESVSFRKSAGKYESWLFGTRSEMRETLKMGGWAEAFYFNGRCYQYINADEKNPYHWFLHETTHQLNALYSGFILRRWSSEALANYFGTSESDSNKVYLGKIDLRTYPVWWFNSENIKSQSLIPLRAIITEENGPPRNKYFNLYYIHWWTLGHFLVHYNNGKYKMSFIELLKNGDDLSNFEKYIGKVEEVQRQWYEYMEKVLLPLVESARKLTK